MKTNKKFLTALGLASFLTGAISALAALYFFFGLSSYNPINLARFFGALHLIETKYVGKIDEDALFNGAINGMVKSLNDPHSLYLNPKYYKMLMEETEGEFGGIGIVMQYDPKTKAISVIDVLKDTPGAKAGVEVGDQILAVNGTPATDMSYDEVASHIRGPIGSKVTLTLGRNEQKIKLTITRAAIQVSTVSSRMIDGDIGYIRIGMFAENTPKEFDAAYEKLTKEHMKGLILDLRSDPGGLLTSCVAIAQKIVPQGKIVSIVERDGKKETFTSSLKSEKYPIVVLIDGNTASAAEILAGALQDTKAAVLVGEKSYGKGSVQQVMPLGYGTALKLTIAKYYTPSGRCIDGVGIEPDVKVKLNPAGQTDNQLEKAIEIMQEKIKAK